jgi:hypothetical protein
MWIWGRHCWKRTQSCWTPSRSWAETLCHMNYEAGLVSVGAGMGEVALQQGNDAMLVDGGFYPQRRTMSLRSPLRLPHREQRQTSSSHPQWHRCSASRHGSKKLEQIWFTMQTWNMQLPLPHLATPVPGVTPAAHQVTNGLSCSPHFVSLITPEASSFHGTVACSTQCQLE